MPHSIRLLPFPHLLGAVVIGSLATLLAIVLLMTGGVPSASAGPVCGQIEQTNVCLDLAPDTDHNLVGTTHTVTATVTEDGGVPSGEWSVSFAVVGGPNTGATLTCNPNADCSLDLVGQISGSYTDTGGVAGWDIISGCLVGTPDGTGTL